MVKGSTSLPNLRHTERSYVQKNTVLFHSVVFLTMLCSYKMCSARAQGTYGHLLTLDFFLSFDILFACVGNQKCIFRNTNHISAIAY